MLFSALSVLDIKQIVDNVVVICGSPSADQPLLFVCTTLFGIACGFDMQIVLNVLILQTFYLQFSLLERTQSINLCSQNLDSTYSENMFQAALSFRSALGTW